MSYREVENPMVIDSLWRNRTINDDYFADVIDWEDEIDCCECGHKWFKEDAAESQIWEDTWICDDKECVEKHHTGWAESMKLQKYYIKAKKHSSGKEHFFMGI